MIRSLPTSPSARLRCTVASAAVLGITVVAVGAITPGYSYHADTVSRLGSPGQPFAFAARTGLVLYGLLVVAGARPLGRSVPGKERLVAALVTLYGFAAVIAGMAPKDLPGAPHTLTSQVHVAATIAGGAAIIAAMVMVALGSTCPLERRASAAVAVLTTVDAAVFGLCWGSGIYGLVERSLLALAALWLVVLAFRMLSEIHPGRDLVVGEEFGETLRYTGSTIG